VTRPGGYIGLNESYWGETVKRWRDEGPKPLAWDPSRTVPDVGTVAEEMEVFVKGLRDGGFHVDLVNVDDDLERVIGAIRLYRPEAVFNLVEFFNEDQVQEAYIAGLYEMLGVQYTGSRPVALANCQNKYRTKIILEAAELPTAGFFLARKGKIPLAEDWELEFPLIVKPALEDASGGIEHASVVQDQAALEARCEHVFKEYEMPALVEEYIEGREIHAAILGNDPPEVLPLFEMEFDDSEFNRVTLAQRQAGSTFKPFVFAAALDEGLTGTTLVEDEPLAYYYDGRDWRLLEGATDQYAITLATSPFAISEDFRVWVPNNFDSRFLGPQTLRRGLELSHGRRRQGLHG